MKDEDVSTENEDVTDEDVSDENDDMSAKDDNLSASVPNREVAVNTGDPANVSIWIACLLISGAVLNKRGKRN